jgi:hypothetical protein
VGIASSTAQEARTASPASIPPSSQGSGIASPVAQDANRRSGRIRKRPKHYEW